MNNLLISLVLVCLILITFSAFNTPSPSEEGVLPDRHMKHIGILVPDIDIALDYWMKLLGIQDKPAIINAEGHEDNPTHFRGKLSDAKAKLAFISLENIQVELIEPYGDAQSHWKEFFANHGPVVHHVAFDVEGIGETYVDLFKESGYSEAQNGGWDGGEYSYMDTQEGLGVIIELLEHYPKK
ncbi:MAG: glyoxalase [Saprospiraceae bacterium]|nr:glyoxalase [Saprospiraceae bacterium]